MDIGEKLFNLRKSRGLTQGQLGKMVGVSEASIRTYENGKRRPKEGHLKRIAKALNVRMESIADYGIVTDNQVIQSLFRLEDKHCKLRPIEVDGSTYLRFENPKLQKAIDDWGKHRQSVEEGDISEDLYSEWKDRYYLGNKVDLIDGEVVNRDTKLD